MIADPEKPGPRKTWILRKPDPEILSKTNTLIIKAFEKVIIEAF